MAAEGTRSGAKSGKLSNKVGDKVANIKSGLVAIRRLSKEIRDLRARVHELEVAMQESRQLSKRLAEITDVVAEVLLPAEQRDEDRIRQLLKDYERSVSHV